MKTTFAMLTLCGLVIGGAAWGRPCPEGEGAAVKQTASPPEQTSSGYEALRPLHNTFEEEDRLQRRWAKENDVYPYKKTSYHALKTEYILWEILKLVRSEGFCK